MQETAQYNRTKQLDFLADAILQYASVAYELRNGLSNENTAPWVKHIAWHIIEWCEDESRALVQSMSR